MGSQQLTSKSTTPTSRFINLKLLFCFRMRSVIVFIALTFLLGVVVGSGSGSALGSERTEEFGGKKMGMGISGAPLGGTQDRSCISRGNTCSSYASTTECCPDLVCAKRYTIFGPLECKQTGQ